MLWLAATGSGWSAPTRDLISPTGWQLAAPAPEDATLNQAATPPEAGSTAVLRVTVTKESAPFYATQLIQSIDAPIPAGDRIVYRFRARATNANPVRAVIEQSATPYQSYAEAQLQLTQNWTTYTIAGVSPGLAAGASHACLQVGARAGEMDFADISVQDTGPDPATLAAQAAVQPAAVASRIRRYRMADFTVKVLDAKGRSVPGAAVTMRQTRHAFLFGCNIFLLNPADTSPEQIAYQKQFAALFNYATLPFYWGAFEPVQGQPQFARLTAMAQWCVQHGITPKAHPLVWHEVYPHWAPADPDATIPLLHARVTSIVTRMNPLVRYYDVVNEASAGALGYTPANGESRWVIRDGAAHVVETALGWARSAGAGSGDTFIYNDYNTGDTNIAMLRQMQADGKLPDVIGIQSHMHTGVWPLTKLWTVCQDFAQFHRPIHFTETTVLSTDIPRGLGYQHGDATDWKTTTQGEANQAAYVTKF